ncbi:MAG: type IV secretory system conjugative DNA transfer family protein, partial [Chloroflexota bacterium]
MTLYRNRDIQESKPINTVVVSAVLYCGIAYVGVNFFQSIIPEEVPLFVAGAGIFLMLSLMHLIWMWMPAHFRRASRYLVKQYRQEQGRLTPKECEQKGLILQDEGLPLASLNKKTRQRGKKMLGKPSGHIEGHTLVVGPTRSGKGMHLTELLYSSNYAMIVVDPKGEQYARTAGYRSANYGPVYTLPGNSLDLSTYYKLQHNDHLTELHFHLMKPWADSQTIFAEKARFLFQAAGAYAQQHALNPMQTLLDAANTAPAVSLEALATADFDAIMNFTNGDAVDKLDKFAASSWGSFTTRMFDYQQHWHTLTQGNSLTAIPEDWASQKATIYITYPFDALKGVGGAVSA